MDTILLFAGYRHLYFMGLSSGVYPVGWIFFKILILESPINTGFLPKRKSNNTVQRVTLLLFDFVPQAGQNFSYMLVCTNCFLKKESRKVLFLFEAFYYLAKVKTEEFL
jgi:hypothetical protein